MRVRLLPRSWMLLLAVLGTAACGGNAPTPSITFTKVPPAAKGGPDVVDTMEGLVTGVRPGQRLVIYARSSVWWVQPGPNMPFTPIREDSTFSLKPSRHGVRCRARRTRPSAARHARNLPREGGSVARLIVVPGDPKAKPVRHTLQFGGYEWTVRAAPSDRGGKNRFDPTNAWTDAEARCTCASPARQGNGRAPR